MVTSWKIKFYASKSGSSPVIDFIESLELKPQTKIYNSIELLKEFGLHIELPHVKKITGTQLWELRILGSNSIRIIYVTIIDQTFLLLHGFRKKTQKTPHKEIKTALIRLNEYKKNNTWKYRKIAI